MLDRVVKHPDLLDLIDAMAPDRRIIGPVRRVCPGCDPPARFFYEEVKRAEQLDLGFNYAVYSPKRFLFPESETLFTFQRERHSFSAVPVFDNRPMALVGVHPCDLHAIRLLDRVFTNDYPDEHYLARRDHTFIIGVDCASPCTAGVFCQDMGTNSAGKGFDLMLYRLDDGGGGNAATPPTEATRFGVVFGTKEGREWLLYSRRGELPSAADQRRHDQYVKAKEAAFPPVLKTPGEKLPDLLGRSYDSLLWEATARRCYSCGSCNLSCPTCYCFNVEDELDPTLSSGLRRREWDGCQLKNFALVAGEHNFRPKAASRLRHRIYRKGQWIRERSGIAGCVGCARCDRACTARISSVEIYNQLAEEV